MSASSEKSPRKSSRAHARSRSRSEDPFAQLPGPTDGEPEPLPGDVSEEIFWDIADSFIETANGHGDTVPVDTVSAALMYASSRYNAFVAVTQHADTTSNDVAARLDVEATVDYFTLQYRKMLEDNLAQYIDIPDADDSEVDPSK